MKKTFILLLMIAATIQMRSQCTTTVSAVASWGGPGTYTNGTGGTQGPFRLCNNAVVYDTMGTSSRFYYVQTGSTLYLKNTFFHYVWLQAASSLVNLGGIGAINVFMDPAASITGTTNQTPTVCSSPSLSFPSPSTCPSPTITGLTTNQANSEISFYPNPASEKLMISNPGSLSLSVTLSDLIGRVVRRIEFNEKEMAIEVADLNEGCYFIRFSSGSSILTKKVLISR